MQTFWLALFYGSRNCVIRLGKDREDATASPPSKQRRSPFSTIAVIASEKRQSPRIESNRRQYARNKDLESIDTCSRARSLLWQSSDQDYSPVRQKLSVDSDRERSEEPTKPRKKVFRKRISRPARHDRCETSSPENKPSARRKRAFSGASERNLSHATLAHDARRAKTCEADGQEVTTEVRPESSSRLSSAPLTALSSPTESTKLKSGALLTELVLCTEPSLPTYDAPCTVDMPIESPEKMICSPSSSPPDSLVHSELSVSSIVEPGMVESAEIEKGKGKTQNPPSKATCEADNSCNLSEESALAAVTQVCNLFQASKTADRKGTSFAYIGDSEKTSLV